MEAIAFPNRQIDRNTTSNIFTLMCLQVASVRLRAPSRFGDPNDAT